MPEWQVALISAGAAILSSALTAYISHRLEWRRRRVEENLRWLEERYRPALAFMARLAAELAGRRPINDAERLSIRRRVEEVARKAWPVAFHLDPEDTGLRDFVLEALRYSRIAESPERLNEYTVGVLRAFETLQRIFLEERDEILSGASLTGLVRKRMDRKRKEEQRFLRFLRELEAFRDGRRTLPQILDRIRGSGIQGELLSLLLKAMEEKAEGSGKDRLAELREACQAHGLLRERGGSHGLHWPQG